MEIISIEGFVVNTLHYGENSKILHILTKEKGVIGVISKGALKPKSKLRSISDNFTYAIFHIYYKEGKLGSLISADVINYFLNIRRDITLIGYLSYLTDLTRNVSKGVSDTKDIYDIFINAVLKIEENFNPTVITNIVEIKYLPYLGISLHLDGCVVCNSNIIRTISLRKGGYVCDLHRDTEPIYDTKVLKLIKAYFYIDISKISALNLSDKVIKEIDVFLNAYYKEYTGLYLKSKNFLNNLKSS